MTAARQTWQVTLRGIRVFMRNPAYIAITLTQPLIWLLLFGALFEIDHEDPRVSRRLLHQLPDTGNRRDARRVLGGVERHGIHRGHRQRCDGP